MKFWKSITIEKIILFLAACFAAYNYGLAGGYIEGTKFSIGGLTAGIVVNISLAIAASRFGSIHGNKRTMQAQLAFWGMVFLSPSLISPVIFYRLPETFLTPLLRVAWSIGWPLVADLAIVLAGAVSGKGLIALGEPSAAQSVSSAGTGAPSAEGSAAKKKRSADAVRTQCGALVAQYACKEPQCGWSPSLDALIASAQSGKNPKNSAASAKAGHFKNQHKPIQIDQSLLIPKEKGT